MTRTSFLAYLLVIFLASANADHISHPDPSKKHDWKCDLKCHNNGVCRFITKDPHQIQLRMQAGKMVQECVCPMGYRGMSCDVKVSKRLCGDNANCDCVTAGSISSFAGEQCHKPATSYCASLAQSIGGHVSFCTHAGKCRGDYLSAQVTPGNTTQNYLFQHAGCVCPLEFKGDHCEVLNRGGYDPVYHSSNHHPDITNHKIPDAAEANQNNNFASVAATDGENDKNMGTTIVFTMVFSASLFILGLVFVRKLRWRRRRNAALFNLPQPPQEFIMSRYHDREEDDEPYHDAIYKSNDGVTDYHNDDDDGLPKIA